MFVHVRVTMNPHNHKHMCRWVHTYVRIKYSNHLNTVTIISLVSSVFTRDNFIFALKL